MNEKSSNSAQDAEVRKGPWTMEEDLILMNYIANHGEGVWNSLAKSAGLKRTGKSCRLRWLNYLRPDVRRGNITPEEQLLIMELHAKWGNRWSKIAKHLPGRTDNEIKNFWRTRIQKHMIKQGDQSSSSDHHMIINCDHQHQATSTSQLSNCSNSADAVDQIPYSPQNSCIYNKQPNMEMEFANNYYTTTTTITTPTLLPPTPPPDSTTDNYWSMEDIWSMQLLNGD